MTAARFDPRNLAMYEKAPPLLHLEFGHQGRVFRYAMVESFPAGMLDPDSRRTQSERDNCETHEQIRTRLVSA